MRIRTTLLTGEEITVAAEQLESLLDAGQIEGFWRDDCFVLVGNDPVRGRPEIFLGRERRHCWLTSLE